MSVLLGINSHGQGFWAQKKGAHTARPLKNQRQATLARGWSLDQIPQPRKGLKRPINRHFGVEPVAPGFALRATVWQAHGLQLFGAG
jgi:hypothetical protein